MTETNLKTDSGAGEEMISMKDVEARVKGRVTFTNQPLKIFANLFVDSSPLEMSVTKYCFQGCPFCFATANKRIVKDVIGSLEDPTNQFIKTIQKANGQGYNPEHLLEYCLRQKYPIVFSNNVDPFLPASEEKYKIGERVLRECLEYKQKLFVQTKEVYYKDAVRSLLIEGKDIFQMYVSLSTLDYDTAKKYETVAITPKERLRRMEDLAKNGMKVVVGLNPYVPEWVPNLREYFKAITDAGCTGIFTEPLHLTSAQKKVMPKGFDRFTSQSNRYDEFHEMSVPLMLELGKEFGCDVYVPRIPGLASPKKAARAWSEDEIWPINAMNLAEAVHSEWLEEKSPVAITWDMCDKFFSQFPEWNKPFSIHSFESAIRSFDNDSAKRLKALVGSRNSIKNAVKYVWNEPDRRTFMLFCQNMFELVDSDGAENGEVEPILDDNGNAIYVYDPDAPKNFGYYWDQSDPEVANKGLLEIDFE